jgi:CPA2 family monovalent cation:H+ antiporter-2
MQEELSFLSLLVVVSLAFLVPLVLARSKRFSLPIVVGEILAGILVGRSGFNLVGDQDPVLNLLAQLGFVFLMFLSGMEIDFNSLGATTPTSAERAGRAWSPLGLAGMALALTLVLSAVCGYTFARLGLVRNPWMMALILSTTSLGVVMPVLKESGLIAGRLGQALLVAAMLADFVTMLLITMLVAVLSRGLAFDILLVGLLFVAFFLIYHFGRLFFDRLPGLRHALEELSHASAQIKVRAAFALILIFVALSEVLGAELILGAFLAGAMLSLFKVPEDDSLVSKLEAIGFGFFIPIFFIMVGVRFDLVALFASSSAVLLLPLLLGAAIAVKLLPVLAFRLSFTWRESLAASALLSARLSLIIAASAIGLRLGVIGEAVNAAIILVAILTVTLAPLIFNRLVPRPARRDPAIVIASANELGLRVAEELCAHAEFVIVAADSPERAASARQRGLEVALVRLDQPDPAVEALLANARAVICTGGEVEYNYRACQLARTRYGVDHVVVQVNDSQERARFEQLGALTFNPALDRVALLALLGRNPALYQLLTRLNDGKEVAEVIVRNPDWIDRPLMQLQLPEDLLVLALCRAGEMLVPHGNTRLQPGDQLTLVGSLQAVAAARQSLTEVDPHS